MSISPLRSLLAALVRDEPVASETLAGIDARAFCHAALQHGVAPLVAERLAGRDDVPVALQRAIGEERRRQVVADLVSGREIQQALATLDAHGVTPLLMKGAALAYTHYARPDLRPRVDTDVLIRPADRPLVSEALGRLGYVVSEQAGGDLLMYQMTYVKSLGESKSHAIDVHWKLANVQAVADLFSYEELAGRAVEVPSLHPRARALGAVDALIVACVHRVAHHFDTDSLIWLYDIHLLARRLDATAWERLATTASERGVANVCAIGLERSASAFGSAAPAWVMARLHAGGASQADRLRSPYLGGSHRHVEAVWADLRALRHWSDRWRLMREHVFPSPRYMRDVYAPASGAPLVVLYARRVVRGARKWLARTSS